MVEAFSPYCHHCQALAPKWQTLYEYYYTSDPLPGSKEPPDPQTSINSFSRYYRFHFGKLDCVAFSDACDDLEVKSYPALMLFKNGERIKKASGDKSMAKLSKFLEESLDVIRPGSRPKGGVELPAVGAQGTGDVNAGEKESEGKQAMKTIPATTAKTAKTATVPRPPAPTLTATPNANGTSEELTPDTFHSRVRDTLDPWFIKFYAPWCHHCQAMQPNWEAMANQMRGKLNIGEVNCQTNAALCREANVKAYPTMKLVRGPEAVEYQGLRGVGDLMDYAEKASAAVAGVPDVDLAQFEKMEKTEEVIFVYFYDHATTSEDFMALERLPIHLLSHAKLVKTQDPALSKRFRISTWPRLMVSRDGKPSIYPKLMPQEMRNVPDLVAWMSANWLPLVPELTAANSKDLTRGKFAVLGILSRARTDEFTSAKRELKSAAIEWMEKREQTFKQERQELRDSKQLRVEEAEDRNDERALNDAKQIHVNMDYFKKRKEVAFAWVDGDFWERWVRTTFGISVRDGERVVIYDHDVSLCLPFSPLTVSALLPFSVYQSAHLPCFFKDLHDRTVLTNIPKDPPLLGPHRTFPTHFPLPLLHCRPPPQNPDLTTPTSPSNHRLQHLTPLLDAPPYLHQPPLSRDFRGHRCCCGGRVMEKKERCAR